MHVGDKNTLKCKLVHPSFKKSTQWSMKHYK